jgi:predicted ATP-binding protein involved in virulence
MTTHSPQIISSIKGQHIRILDHGKSRPFFAGTYGAQSWRILEGLFNVPSRPNNETAKMIKNYLNLINMGQALGEEALKLRSQLEEWIPNDPVLRDADLLIRQANWQNKKYYIYGKLRNK